MKLKVFHSADGDCLLLTSKDGHHALIDGGRSGTFQTQTWKTLQGFASKQQPIDLVVVSHIDADHISGILWLMKAVAAWAVYDFQVEAGNKRFPKPAMTRPPTIGKIWHNSWRAQLGDLTGPIEAFINQVDAALQTSRVDTSRRSRVAINVLGAVSMLAQSIPDGVELRRVIDDDTPVPRNGPFKDLVLLRNPPHIEKLGAARLSVIGPAKKHLEALRQEWRDWLADVARGAAVETAAPGAAPTAGLAGMDFATAHAADLARGEQLIASVTAAAEVIATTDPKRRDSTQPCVDHPAGRGRRQDVPAHRGRQRGGAPRGT